MNFYIVAPRIAGTREYATIAQTKRYALTLSHADCVRAPCPLSSLCRYSGDVQTTLLTMALG